MQTHPNYRNIRYSSIYIFCALLTFAAFIFDSPADIWRGCLLIITSPSNLITDYIEIGGIGATFLNSAMVLLLSALSLQINRIELKGSAVAGLITLCGFAFFGKNLYNSLPITAGAYLYASLRKLSPKEVAVPSLFATALGPLVSVLSFGMGLELWKGIMIGCGTGILIGIITPPLADSFYNFHRGFSLYNIGFTAGIIGMFAAGILRMFDLKVDTVSIISSGNNLVLSVILLSIFTVTLLFGLYNNNWSFSGYKELFKHSGRLQTDFITLCGLGVTLINIAIMGFIGWAYVILVKGELNGATLGAIFTLMGFSAYGNHPKNTLPIFAGALLASFLNVHDPSGTVAITTTLFGSTLAPIAGYFGALAGVLTGFAHVSMSMNIGYLHGGMNLYNNGFSGGFIAATLVPLFSAFAARCNSRRRNSPE